MLYILKDFLASVLLLQAVCFYVLASCRWKNNERTEHYPALFWIGLSEH
jgi:hypothetical protein